MRATMVGEVQRPAEFEIQHLPLRIPGMETGRQAANEEQQGTYPATKLHQHVVTQIPGPHNT